MNINKPLAVLTAALVQYISTLTAVLLVFNSLLALVLLASPLPTNLVSPKGQYVSLLSACETEKAHAKYINKIVEKRAKDKCKRRLKVKQVINAIVSKIE